MTGSDQRPAVLFVLGPTASGKTDLAIALKAHFNGQLINVDSAQVYKGLDIGAAKPDAATLAVAPHRLLDFRDPAEPYSAADFVNDAEKEVADIVAAGQLPILVGGTMLYFKALLDGLAPLPAADQAIRREIEDQAEAEGWPALHRQLEQVDPVTAAALHPNHSQRIQRALEVYRLTGTPISVLREQHRLSAQGFETRYRVIQLALLPDNRQLLHQRINQRLDIMLRAGLVAEVQALCQRGDLSPQLPAIRSAGYRQFWDYCEGKCTVDEALERAKAATRQLAKRQLTWLKNWPNIHRVSVDDGEKYYCVEEIFKLALKNLSKESI